MDFFAAGGFQQLLSELNDEDAQQPQQQLAPSWPEANAYAVQTPEDQSSKAVATLNQLAAARSPFRAAHFYDGAEEWMPLAAMTDDGPPLATFADVNVNAIGQGNFDYNNNNNNSNNSSNSHDNNSHDSNNNNSHCEASCEAQLQRSLDLLLTSSGAADAPDCAAELFTDMDMRLSPTTDGGALQMTREMAEWEDKFLDNYIEIPELIDILPEKTPLCTEMCELFLQESSTNLQLHSSDDGDPAAGRCTSKRLAGKSRAPAPGQSTRRYASRSAATAGGDGVAAGTDGDCERSAAGYPCSFGTCQNVYAKPAHLKAHLRRHLGEKPYVCNWQDCTWKFSRSDELARHRRSHSGVKPYKCVYCTKCFARSDHLTKHRKVHERRMLAAAKTSDGVLPASVFTVRPGRKKKNQIF